MLNCTILCNTSRASIAVHGRLGALVAILLVANQSRAQTLRGRRWFVVALGAQRRGLRFEHLHALVHGASDQLLGGGDRTRWIVDETALDLLPRWSAPDRRGARRAGAFASWHRGWRRQRVRFGVGLVRSHGGPPCHVVRPG